MANYLEQALQYVNRDKVHMSIDQIKSNNEILRNLTSIFEAEFKSDPFFASIYERYFFGGSFYDGLKVGKPNEFDIDLVLKIPAIANPTIYTNRQYPGLVQIHIPNLHSLPEYDYGSYRQLKEFVTEDNYISIPRVMKWFQQRIQIIINKLNSFDVLPFMIQRFAISRGPAITFSIKGKFANHIFDVDFVPSFKFPIAQWPGNCRVMKQFKDDDLLTQEFLVVPKYHATETYLRLSFQGQERRLLDNKGALKPAIKLLKLYRNNYKDAQIKSYYIKTLALWALEDDDFEYTGKSLTKVFLQLFNLLRHALKIKQLPYYWDARLDFFEDLSEIYCTDVYNRMTRDLREFQQANINNDAIIFKFTKFILEAAMEWEDTPIDYKDEFGIKIYNNMYKNRNSKYVNPGPSLFYNFFKWLFYSWLLYGAYVNRELLFVQFIDLCDFIVSFINH